MANDKNGSSESRLDRIERLLELQARQFHEGHGQLLKSHEQLRMEQEQLFKVQVLMHDSLQKLIVAQERANERVALLDERIGLLMEGQQHADARIAALAEGQQHADARIAALAEAQERVDESLSALIRIVDELIRKPPTQ